MRYLHQRLQGGLALALGVAALPAAGQEPALLALAGAAEVQGAGEAPEAPARPERRRRYDYSRFSNGPRRVPEPRGAAYARARALGIGGVEPTRRLLRGRIDPRVLAAVRGEAPTRLLWPVVGGRFGRGFGFVRKLRTDLRHNGVDIAAKEGDIVRAAADGLVIYSDNTLRGFGNAVVILHPNGWTTLYAHNRRNTVQPGWHARRGERIALVGSTGIARGPHLHFELRDRGRLRDPARLFVGRRSREIRGPLVELPGAPAPSVAPESVAPAAPQPPNGEPAAAARAPASDEASNDTDLGFALGSAGTARALLRGELAAPEGVALGRKFSDLLWPVRGGAVSRAFDARGHRAVDIAAPADSAVRAAADGVVVYSGELAGFGRTVVLLHENDWVTVYGGNRETAVRPGQRVLRGEWIARVGQSAAGDEPHLHFEWRVAGRPRDPLPSLTARP